MPCGAAACPGAPSCFGGITGGCSFFLHDVPARANTRNATNTRQDLFISPFSSSFLSAPSPGRRLNATMAMAEREGFARVRLGGPRHRPPGLVPARRAPEVALFGDIP